MTLDELVDIAVDVLYESSAKPPDAQERADVRAAVRGRYLERAQFWDPEVLAALDPEVARDALRDGTREHDAPARLPRPEQVSARGQSRIPRTPRWTQ